MLNLLIIVFLWIVVISLILALMYTMTFSVSMLFGAVFVPSSDAAMAAMIKLAAAKKTDKIVDLGSGDGKLVIALAQKGYGVEGVEINPILVRRSRELIKKLGLEKRATIRQGNFWRVNFSGYDVVLLYGTTYIMKRLEKKLQKELRPGARVISNYFQFPTWKAQKKSGIVRVYVKK